MPHPRLRPQRFTQFLLLLAGWLAACAPLAPPAVTRAADRISAATLSVTVPSGLPADALRAAVAAYAASGGLPVTVHALPNDAYLDTVSALLLAGSSQYDLLYLPAGSLARWVRYHALRPFAAPVDRVRFGPWLSPLVFADGLYGLPAQVDPLVLWVRADWLGSGGPPRDWEAFREAALRLNNPPNRYGAALAASEFSAGEDLAALLPGFGGQAVRVEAIRSDAEYAVILDDIPAQRALAFYADLAASGVTPSGSKDFTRDDVIRALADGRAAMGLAPLSAGKVLLDCDASPKACAQAQPALVPTGLPGVDGMTGGCAFTGELSAWAMPLHAARPQEAEKFALWLSSAEGARAWAEGGGLPAQVDALAGLPASVPAAMRETAAALARAGCYPLAFPATLPSEALWKALHQAAHDAAAGAQTPRQALTTAAQAMRAALRKEGDIP